MKRASGSIPRAATCRRLVIGVALSFAFTAPAGAKDPFKAWNQKFRSAIERLESGQSEKALEKLDDLLEEYAELAGPGATNERNLGAILVHKAIAEQALGRAADAQWTWDVAVNFLPGAASFDLSRFGETGRSLHEYAVLAEARDESNSQVEEIACDHCDGRTPPKPIKSVNPRYPVGARQFFGEGALVVRVLIDEEGRARHPRVVRKLAAPALTYSAFKALREWRFEPATFDGKPIPVYYVLTVNYKLRK
jgi:TonB family protein